MGLCNIDPAGGTIGQGFNIHDSACVNGEVWDLTGTFDVHESLDIGGDNQQSNCGDFRTTADANGRATLTMSLTVTDSAVSFDGGLAGCPTITRPLDPTASVVFDPSQPAWVYIVSDDDNMNFVEIMSVSIIDGAGSTLYSTTFNDQATFAEEWVAGGAMDSIGCVGDPEKQTVFALPHPFLEISGPRLAMQAIAAGPDSDASGSLGVASTSDFLVEMTIKPDWLAPTTTDNDVAILVCNTPGLTQWSATGTSGCAVFSIADVKIPSPKTFIKKAAMPSGQILGEAGDITCPISPLVTLQLHVTPSQMVFTDVHTNGDISCGELSVGNPFGAVEQLYVYMAVDDSSLLWTTVVDFKIVDGAYAAPTTSPPLGLAFVQQTCVDVITMWIWAGTSTCGPNYDYALGRNFFVGELRGGEQGLQFDGSCVGPIEGTVFFQGTCGSTTSTISSFNAGVGGCNGLVFDSATNVNVGGAEMDFGACYSFDASVLYGYGLSEYAPSAACVGGGSCGSIILTGKCPDVPSPPPTPPSPPSPPPPTPPSPPPPLVPPSPPAPAEPALVDTEALQAAEELSTGLLAGIIVIAVVCVVLIFITIWALNNKMHGRPIFTPIFKKPPPHVAAAGVQMDSKEEVVSSKA